MTRGLSKQPRVESPAAAADLSPYAALTLACKDSPLAPGDQVDLLCRVRAANSVIRDEVGRFPAALELLKANSFAGLTDEMCMRVDAALAETDAMWTERHNPVGQVAYAERIEANRKLFLATCHELFETSARPYSVIETIERDIMRRCGDAVALFEAAEGSDAESVKVALEERYRRSGADIVAAHERMVSAQAEAAPLKDLLVRTNLRLVAKEAIAAYRRMSRTEELTSSVLDLFQAGTCGLLTAIERFRPEFETHFSTYAIPWVRQAIGRAVEEEGLVAVPRRTRQMIARERRARDELRMQTGSEPTDEDVFGELRFGQVHRQMVSLGNRALTLKAVGVVSSEGALPGFEAEVETTHDVSAAIERSEDSLHVARAVERVLSGRMRSILAQRYLATELERPGAEAPAHSALAEQWGVSRTKVSQLEQRAVGMLTDYFIVVESPPLLRNNVMKRVLKTSDRAIIDNLLGDDYQPTVSGVCQARVLTRLAMALVVAEMSPGEWHQFAKKHALPQRAESLVGVAPLGALARTSSLRGEVSELAWREASASGENRDQVETGAALGSLAPHLRLYWRRQRGR